MKKSDLCAGMIAKTRNGTLFAYVPYCTNEIGKYAFKEIFKGHYTLLDKWTDDLRHKYYNGQDIVKIQTPFGGVWERPAEILDDVEKEYLAAALKPFIKQIKSITKYRIGCTVFEFIDIDMINASWSFPNFKKGTKYKGMKTGKSYTPEELGL